jgi:hypothetical protein
MTTTDLITMVYAAYALPVPAHPPYLVVSNATEALKTGILSDADWVDLCAFVRRNVYNAAVFLPRSPAALLDPNRLDQWIIEMRRHWKSRRPSAFPSAPSASSAVPSAAADPAPEAVGKKVAEQLRQWRKGQ